MPNIKVLIVDDSALVRQMLSEIFKRAPGIEVVGVAQDPYMAREKIKALNPDVLTLDVEMPRMDGVTFLKNLMRLRPMPVIMVSSLTERGADVTLDALEFGAVDFVTKPKVDLAHSLEEYAEEIVEKVRAAAKTKVSSLAPVPPLKVDAKNSADAVLERRAPRLNFETTDKLIAIGASTGGTEAIKELLIAMPADSPGIVITQHIPQAFSAPFAARMNSVCEMTVFEASDGQQIVPGHVYIAPGDKHLIVERSGARFICRLNDGPRVNRHKPAVDVLFRSVAQNIGANAIGVILTGMGDDGALGLQEMKEAGSVTVAQDENTSVVWGMPGEAVKLGCVDYVLPLNSIAPRLVNLLKTKTK